MNVPATCRGGLYPPCHQLRLSIERDWHRVQGRMQSAPTKLVCSFLNSELINFELPDIRLEISGELE
jgi:hypothetical protein